MVPCLHAYRYFIYYCGAKMNISIRKSKQQKTPMTDGQLDFAVMSIKTFKDKGFDVNDYMTSRGTIDNEKIVCEIKLTKTQISAVVYHG
jgi:hypothetical protein